MGSESDPTFDSDGSHSSAPNGVSGDNSMSDGSGGDEDADQPGTGVALLIIATLFLPPLAIWEFQWFVDGPSTWLYGLVGIMFLSGAILHNQELETRGR